MQLVEDIINNFWGIFIFVVGSSVVYDNFRSKQ